MSSGKKPDDVRPEYVLATLKNGGRGKYLKRYQQGSNVVLIDPDLAEAFPNAKAVNDALREILSRRQREDASAK
jgi:hypothetical protein